MSNESRTMMLITIKVGWVDNWVNVSELKCGHITIHVIAKCNDADTWMYMDGEHLKYAPTRELAKKQVEELLGAVDTYEAENTRLCTELAEVKNNAEVNSEIFNSIAEENTKLRKLLKRAEIIINPCKTYERTGRMQECFDVCADIRAALAEGGGE